MAKPESQLPPWWKMRRQPQSSSAPSPEPVQPSGVPRTLLDSLSALIGGRPKAVIDAIPPAGPTAGGEYRSHTIASQGDTVYVDPNGNSIGAPHDYVLTHELGHRLFEQSDPQAAEQFRPSGIRDTTLGRIAGELRRRNLAANSEYGALAQKYSGHDASEQFAEAFGNAVSDLRATPTHPAYHDTRPPDGDTAAISAWLQKQPLFAGRMGALAASAAPTDATAVARALPLATDATKKK